MMQLPERVIEKFYSSIKLPVNDAECWEWMKGKVNGYGSIKMSVNNRTVNYKAHRVSWIIYNGQLPDLPGAHGAVVRHMCNNRSCVNPSHLQAGTQYDNVQDQKAAGTLKHGSFITPWNKGTIKELCKYGHIKVTAPKGQRYCPECHTRYYNLKKGK